ncbi:hypothetical protein Barb4_03925 [Bacteroidales bacterium Barb4]|nr:hypothetical protein Barb4_03925 [Bacteroidales bacterium Barb4]
MAVSPATTAPVDTASSAISVAVVAMSTAPSISFDVVSASVNARMVSIELLIELMVFVTCPMALHTAIIFCHALASCSGSKAL